MLPSFAPFRIPETDEPLIMQMVISPQLLNIEPEGVLVTKSTCANAIFHIYETSNSYKIFIYTLHETLTGVLISNKDYSKHLLSLFGTELEKCYALNNAVMFAFTFSGAYHHIILMHASVIAHNDFGYLFLGTSGTGKSTHSQLWLKHISGSSLLNDDNPAIRILKNGQIEVFGTPWSGKTPCYKNLHFQVRAFVKLEQYRKNIIYRKPLLQSFASILSSTSSMIWDKDSYNLIIKSIELIAQGTSTYHLRCLPNKAAAELSYKTIIHPNGKADY